MNNRIPGVPGIVNQDVESTPGLDRFLDNAIREGGIRNVARVGNGYPTGGLYLCGSLFGWFGIYIGYHYLRPLPGKERSDRSPNPPAGPGYNCYPVFQELLHS
jgi:hypothetical protein